MNRIEINLYLQKIRNSIQTTRVKLYHMFRFGKRGSNMFKEHAEISDLLIKINELIFLYT